MSLQTQLAGQRIKLKGGHRCVQYRPSGRKHYTYAQPFVAGATMKPCGGWCIRGGRRDTCRWLKNVLQHQDLTGTGSGQATRASGTVSSPDARRMVEVRFPHLPNT